METCQSCQKLILMEHSSQKSGEQKKQWNVDDSSLIRLSSKILGLLVGPIFCQQFYYFSIDQHLCYFMNNNVRKDIFAKKTKKTIFIQSKFPRILFYIQQELFFFFSSKPELSPYVFIIKLSNQEALQCCTCEWKHFPIQELQEFVLKTEGILQNLSRKIFSSWLPWLLNSSPLIVLLGKQANLVNALERYYRLFLMNNVKQNGRAN